MLDQLQAECRSSQQLRQRGLALLDRLAPQIGTVDLDEIESIEKCLRHPVAGGIRLRR